jgi:signal transduction histidine kinase
MPQTLIFTYFLYGLAFFAMGLAMLLETGRSPALAEARSLRFLAAFGIIHGTHEWLESYQLQSQLAGTPTVAWLVWFKLGLLTSSFIALFIYAYLTLRLASRRYQGRRLLHFDRLAIYEAVIILTVVLTYRDRPVQWPLLLDGLARYTLAIPAAALAGLALYTQTRQFRREGRVPLAAPLAISAAGFAVYAGAQLFVRPLGAFPAQYLNQESFAAVFGFPIQAVRTLAAVVITVGLIRATQLVEQERRAQLVAAHRARLVALEERDALRRDLLQHIVRSQEDERARIARELHDEIAQYLSAFSLELGALKSTLKQHDTNRMVDHLQGLARQMSQSLYRLVRDLRPSQLDDLGLVPALRSWIAQDCNPRGLGVEFDVRGNPERLNPLVETVVFRVAQEALNNVSRHAGVKQVKVALEYSCDQVAIRISDEGVGFDPSEQFRPPRGWGLAGMRERVESLAGQLTLQSSPGQGTTVQVVIPLKDKAGKEVVYGADQITPGG